MAFLDDLYNNTIGKLTGTQKVAPSGAGQVKTTAGPQYKQNNLATPPPIATAPSNALELQLLDAQLQALRAQSAARPKLPTLNTADMRAKAQASALSSVNPVYQDKLNNQLERYALQRTQQTADVSANKTAADVDLTNLRADIGTDRTRTTEDVQSAVDQSLYNEGQFQSTEGTQFDIANREARGAVADAGLTESGLGQQSLEKLQSDRNLASTAQLKDFTDERATQELFKTRTFEDLGTKEVRATELNDVTKQNLDRQLNDFIAMQAQDERDFRLDNEAERQGALFNATNQVYDTDIQQWLASLKSQGYRDQDIALAAQVYG